MTLAVSKRAAAVVIHFGRFALHLLEPSLDLLSFGELGLVVAGDHGDGLEMSSGHDLVLITKVSEFKKAIKMRLII